MSGSTPDAGERSCRLCGARTPIPVLDLGSQPLATRFPSAADLRDPEPRWPLVAFLCPSCWLVQLEDGAPLEEAGGGYWSGPVVSPTMRAHAEALVADVVGRSSPGGPRRIVEMASHGGYLGDLFRERGIETVAVEPVGELVRARRAAGFTVVQAEFAPEVAADLVATGGQADLIVDNYRLAHVREPARTLAGLSLLLAPGGTAVLEFDHLLPVLAGTQFDAIRHGHLSYFSLLALERGLAANGLAAYDAVKYPVYGGVLRVFVGRAGEPGRTPTERLEAVRAAERGAGLESLEAYLRFADSVAVVTGELVRFLREEQASRRVVAAYGAPSRGNTLLNTCGITPELVAFTVDLAPAKQGRYLPGSRLEIRHPDRLRDAPPDVVLILTWDLAAEVVGQLADLRSHGTRFVVPIPRLAVVA